MTLPTIPGTGALKAADLKPLIDAIETRLLVLEAALGEHQAGTQRREAQIAEMRQAMKALRWKLTHPVRR